LNHVKKLKAEGKTWEDFELHEIKHVVGCP